MALLFARLKYVRNMRPRRSRPSWANTHINYARRCQSAPNAALSGDDVRYRDKVLRPFFDERLATYACAAERARQPKPTNRRPALRERLTGWWQVRRFTSQISKRIP